MWSAFIAGIVYDCSSMAEVARLLKNNRDVRLVCGFGKDNLPGEDALGRILKKLTEHEDLPSFQSVYLGKSVPGEERITDGKGVSLPEKVKYSGIGLKNSKI